MAEIDREAARLLAAAEEHGYETIVCSEYAIEAVDSPVFVNRVLREHGFLEVHRTLHGELLDAGASRAFAVCDHQIAHVYVEREADLPRVMSVLERVDGVASVLDRDAQRAWDLGHPRAGELVLLAERGCWFAYPYWLDEKQRPDFAPTVDIHRKPGYDPAELFLDPKLRFPRLRIAGKLLRRKLGFRTLFDLVPTDPSCVRGSHGLPPSAAELGPLYLASPGLKLSGSLRTRELLFETRGR